MLKTIKFIPFVALLGFNMTMVSCSFINENEENKQILNKKITEEQKLIEAFKANFSPTQGQKFEESLAEAKENYTSSDWNTKIREVEALRTEIASTQDTKSKVENDFKGLEIIRQLIPDLPATHIGDNKIVSMLQNYLAILYNMKEQHELRKISSRQ